MSEQAAVLIGIASTFGVGMLSQWTAWRFKLPAIVLLFVAGLLLGPIFGIIHPAEGLGDILHPMVSLMVAIIVFEGAMALDFEELIEAGEGVARIIFVALPINWFLGTLAAHWIGQFSWSVSLVFGAIVVVTGPTVVLPMLRANRLDSRVGSILRWEAIINDSLGAVLASLSLQLLLANFNTHEFFFLTSTVPKLLFAAVGASIIGFLPALLMKYLFSRGLMPELFKFPALLVTAMLVYQVCALEIEGAGLVSVTVFGMGLANLHIAGIKDLRRSKESLTILIVSVLFITLTANLDRAVITDLSIPLLMLTLAVMFLVRPVGLFIATLKTGLCWREIIFTSLIAPRGIVAAAVAGNIGLSIGSKGDATASGIVPGVFLVIAVTMTFCGFSFAPLARWLKLSSSVPPGIAIVGSHPWTNALAECIVKAGGNALMVDRKLVTLQDAYQKGVSVLRANLLSHHGQELVQERPVDFLLAATKSSMFNGMVCSHIAPEMGRARVFQLSPGDDQLGASGVSRDLRGRIFGEATWTFNYFDTFFDTGWRFYSREVTKESLENRDPHVLDLMVLRKGVLISICSSEEGSLITPIPGDVVIYFGDHEVQRNPKPSEGPDTDIIDAVAAG